MTSLLRCNKYITPSKENILPAMKQLNAKWEPRNLLLNDTSYKRHDSENNNEHPYKRVCFKFISKFIDSYFMFVYVGNSKISFFSGVNIAMARFPY